MYNTHALAHHTLYSYAPAADRERLLGYLRSDAETVRDRSRNPYSLGTPYTWGTAEGAAGAALTCLLYAAGDYADPEERVRSWATPTSLRNVDAECRGVITGIYALDSGGTP